jgi:hypothetical protein
VAGSWLFTLRFPLVDLRQQLVGFGTVRLGHPPILLDNGAPLGDGEATGFGEHIQNDVLDGGKGARRPPVRVDSTRPPTGPTGLSDIEFAALIPGRVY